MPINEIVKQMPCWYLVTMFIFSLYYSVRGVLEQREKSKKDRSIVLKIFIDYIQEFIFKFIFTVSAFMALYMAYWIAINIKSINDISVGTAGVLVFLLIWGITGVAGYLTFLIVTGRFPGKG